MLSTVVDVVPLEVMVIKVIFDLKRVLLRKLLPPSLHRSKVFVEANFEVDIGVVQVPIKAASLDFE